MRTPIRPLVFALVALAGLLGISSQSFAAASHVVISQFATRGPTAATDEFVELYNPTSSAIDLSGWKMQYKSATGSTWSDRAALPANTSIPAHGYFLLANQSYIGTVTPDYSSGLWNSGTGMADNGHERIIDAAAVQVDLVGWGTANAPEGGTDAPNHGTSANGNSVMRKALATSTADSLAVGGAHALLGNGQDTDFNGSDFVAQTHGRYPRNSSTSPAPPFANGGSGTGRVAISPSPVFTSHPVPALVLAFHQDSLYTITNIAITVPTTWTWSHSTTDVALGGSAFASATSSVVGETLFVAGAALSPADDGTVTIANLTAPAAKGGSTFATRTAVASGTLTQLPVQPGVRILDLVAIAAVHVNDANGVCAAPYAVGAEATVSGIVTANTSSTRLSIYVQDATAGINVYNAALLPVTPVVGDSVTVTGTILQFRGLTELQADFALYTLHASGRPVPDPLVMTCADLNATFRPDYTEPNEGRLVRINGVTYNSTTSTITDATGTATIFIPTSFPPAPSVFDAIGIIQQYKPGTPAPGAPYTADYELAPRTPDDIIAHAGPVVLTAPYEDNIQPTSVQIHWTTDVASTSIVRFGVTSALGDSAVDPSPVTTHAVTLTGLQPATIYSYSVGSADSAGVNFTSTALFSTASPTATSGAMNVYFNHSVDAGLAWLHTANGNADLVAQLLPRINNAHRSIDAALYSLSGTPGATIASALIAARSRGVDVRVICEYDNSTSSGFTTLAAAGVPLINDRFDPTNYGAGLMHNKFFVVDSRGGAPESTWVFTGSWNPTDPGTYDDDQNSIEIQDQALANVYTTEFNEMWGSATDTPNAALSRFGARKLDNTPHKFVIGGRKCELYFSPSDGTNYHIKTTIYAAQHSIGFQLLTMTMSDLSAALISRHNAGVHVRGDMDNRTDSGSEYDTLVAAGIDMHLKTGTGLLHHKYMIVDADDPHYDGIVLTGSHNWSSSAENSNNENTLIIHDPDVANQYLQEFTARYYEFGGTDSVHVTAAGTSLPQVVSLAPNFPNPFRGTTQIAYTLPVGQRVSLTIYDVQGRAVRSLVNATQPAGRYTVTLRAQDLAAGVYLCRLVTPGGVHQRKLLLLN